MPGHPIEKTSLLIVEGKDEVAFFGKFFEEKFFSNIDVRDAGGKSRLGEMLEDLTRTSGWSAVKSLAIMRDADDDVGSAVGQLKGLFRARGLHEPDENGIFSKVGSGLRTAFYVLPDGKTQGNLESLVLKTLAGEDPVMACVESFLKCSKFRPEPPKELSAKVFLHSNDIWKAKMKAYLAARGHDFYQLGTAAQAGVWDWNNMALEPLRKFLADLNG